ncbi:hypothetical protein OS493_039658 [Desmophyllum pertusum]|uniref:Uncharacterized protein n=1 Tax=Desmophyllum pertusum TaxID=174260 RepID=A0A9W9YH49_9CNID|nr:hypothetical protein OS493_039658 [Desmophyllum pertusum]
MKTEGAVVASPAVSVNGTVYVGSQDKLVYASWRAKHWIYLWKTDLHCPIWGSGVAVDNQRGLLFVGCTSDKLKRFRLAGTRLIYLLSAINWVKSFGRSERRGKRFMTATGNWQAVCTGHVKHPGSEVESSPVVSRSDGTLYVGLIKDQLIAVNTVQSRPLAGKIKWTVGILAGRWCRPTCYY